MKKITTPNPQKERLYIAYGSNLNLEQMAKRCPTAVVVGKTYLRNHQLIFRHVATVEARKGGKVPVLIWQLQPKDERILDVYEGYPRLYRKENLRVTVNGKRVCAMIYLMNNAYCYYSLPNESYYGTIADGYRDCDFDLKYLEQAVAETKRHIVMEGGATHDGNH